MVGTESERVQTGRGPIEEHYHKLTMVRLQKYVRTMKNPFCVVFYVIMTRTPEPDGRTEKGS